MNCYKNLHNLEERLIEIEYLVKALNRLTADEGLQICLLTLLEERLDLFKLDFYRHWHATVRT